jgi:HSP90 family molecular chaperone
LWSWLCHGVVVACHRGGESVQAEESPYMEALLANGTEVLYSFDQLDDVVFSNVGEYKAKGRDVACKFVSVETSSVDLPNSDTSELDASEPSTFHHPHSPDFLNFA